MTDIAKLAIQAETNGVTKAQGELDKLSTSAGKAEKSTKNYTSQSNQATKASGSFSSGARNLSFQLSQVAQQGAVTGNYLQALTIQLPDMLLSFGTLGILVGAAAGALGGPLIDALTGSSQAVKDLDEELGDLGESFETLTDKQRQYFAMVSAQKQVDLEEQFTDLSEEIKTAATELNNLEKGFRRTARGQRISIAADPEDIREAQFELTKLEAARENLSSKIQSEIALQEKLGRTSEQTNEAIRAQVVDDALADRIDNFDKLRDAILNKNKTEKELAIQGASEINSELALAYSNNIIDFNEYRSLRAENQLALQDDLTNIDAKGAAQRSRILSDEQQKTLGYTGQFFGNLADIAKEGGEEQFDNYKMLASTQALISASMAVLGVLGDPSIPTLAKPVFATAMAGLAAVQIAAINQQEYQGARAMGGQVNSGNSYLVGENGPEIVHMNGNGNVQANHNMGGENNVTVNLSFQSGVTKADLAAALPSVSKAVYNQVFAAINAGGTQSQAVRRRA